MGRLAQILGYSGCQIDYGEALLNDSYLSASSPETIQHIACQEIGHPFGLDHQYASDTCMNDAIAFSTPAPFPNSHDRDLLNAMYAPAAGATFYEHLDYTGGEFGASSDVSFVGWDWNDQITSVRVPSGRTVVLYEHIDYGGAWLTLTGDANDLRDFPGPSADGTWNDAASSVRIY